MLTQKDLKDINELIKKQIEEAIAQISLAMIKTLENVATKEDLQKLATGVEERFGMVEERFDEVEGRLDGVEGRLSRVEERLDRVEIDLTDIKRDLQDLKADMPTKEDFQTLKKLEKTHRKELATYA